MIIGGIHICGFARTNAEGGKGSSEIGGATYGGDKDDDNSGVLKFVRVEYTGYAFDEEHEANGITFETPDNPTIIVKGIDKQAVGQMAAVIRGKRPPEPYHGKGVKYSDERIRRKAGKTGK